MSDVRRRISVSATEQQSPQKQAKLQQVPFPKDYVTRIRESRRAWNKRQAQKFRKLIGFIFILFAMTIIAMDIIGGDSHERFVPGHGYVYGRGNGYGPSSPDPAHWPKPRTKKGSMIHPLVIGCYFDSHHDVIIKTSKISRIRYLPIYDEDKYPSKRQVEFNDEFHKSLQDSKKYGRMKADNAVMRGDDCSLPDDWMTEPHPVCNTIHEKDLTSFYSETSTAVEEDVRLVADGFWRDVWKMRDYRGSLMATKTLRYEHDYTERNFDRHQRDSVAMERTTSSSHIMDMFAYCGHTSFGELAEGSVSDMIWPETGRCDVPMKDRLDVALHIAKGLMDFHFPSYNDGTKINRVQKVAMAHTDITPSQFLFVNGRIKLNDFNRCRFIARRNNGKACPFRVGSNPGKFRSPEEYAYEKETEKIDVYSMGNIFYSLLTELWPFEKTETKKAQDAVLHGERPPIEAGLNTSDPHVQIMLSAMDMCWTYNPRERPSSKEVVTYMEEEIAKLEHSRQSKISD